MLVISGDEAVYDPRVLELAARARFVLTTAMFMGEHTLQSHLVVPGASYLERDGTTVNLEGRRAAPAPRGHPAGRVGRARVLRPAWRAFRGRRLALGRAPPPEQAELEPRGERRPVDGRSRRRLLRPKGSGLAARPLPAALLRPRRRADRCSSSSSAPPPRSSSPGRTPRPASSRPATSSSVAVERDEPRAPCAGQPAAPCRASSASPRSTRRASSRRASEVRKADLRLTALNQPWWIDIIKAFFVVNLVLGAFAYLTWTERKVLGPHAEPLRAEPRRALRAPPADRRPRQAAPEGELRAGRRDRRPLLRGAGRRRVHGARGLQRHPVRRRLALGRATTSPAGS